ncbi:unnamed protein product [Trichogramma brassicae]|uniref:Uncharacterized protein n=1 Tax=Trichogramma brassicae TaxID=86971 RepID=A0A6H5IH12_9HYME|nr:unnamed protein product [Trichogramma brassicae]
MHCRRTCAAAAAAVAEARVAPTMWSRWERFQCTCAVALVWSAPGNASFPLKYGIPLRSKKMCVCKKYLVLYRVFALSFDTHTHTHTTRKNCQSRGKSPGFIEGISNAEIREKRGVYGHGHLGLDLGHGHGHGHLIHGHGAALAGPHTGPNTLVGPSNGPNHLAGPHIGPSSLSGAVDHGAHVSGAIAGPAIISASKAGPAHVEHHGHDDHYGESLFVHYRT